MATPGAAATGPDSSVVGVRIYADGNTASSKQSLLSSFIAISTLTLYTGWMHFLLLLIVASFFSSTASVLLLAIWVTVLLPAKPTLWKAFNESYVFSTWRDYFSFSYLFEETLDHKKRYVFVEFPHGVFPMGPLLAGTLCQVCHVIHFHARGGHLLQRALSTETALLLVPASLSLLDLRTFLHSGWRHFTAWIGSVPATTTNFKRVLRKGSVAVIVGGIAEMFMASKTSENVMLKTRKGFVRVAVEEGIDGGIVPVYHFGNSAILDFWPQSASKLSRKLRAALGFLCGRMGLPTPRSRPIFMVTGRSIPVKQMSPDAEGFEAEVDRVHGLVMAELQALYERHKAEYGETRPLVIQ